MSDDWTRQFPGLSRLDPALREVLLRESTLVSVPEGAVIFGPHTKPESLLLLLDGRVRVQQLSESGREIVLYRVEAGESCVMTTACLLAHEEYSAEGLAETAVRAAAIPRAVFDGLVAASVEFRTFIFTAYARRMADLFLVIEEIAFQRLDIRLAQKLVELARGTGQIRATHQQMAAELGTAREVVSRLLGEFQRRGWIARSRGVVALTDIPGIEALAAQDQAWQRSRPA
ncbi:Crp/Fnr family transcriptional regulator [Paracoccus spongiarum]|uniref:Crp/Fnr family transcriptional regulator n=1 Tax=Paracoccus spongiarum TaxID=3064387 RepID=A0ABT9JC75_9RHOB|nr:Crp/Fnr family transcriptional regulator [Paracoccus sp. 2205BS29-5]MDP5307406.1 Crp/Fnr family transcriptional regulator [Paracoccus sp. 2205BS29-5]